jgi:hypothetical protein
VLRLIRNIAIVAFSIFFWSHCTPKQNSEKAVRSLVYEGMSAQDLERVLGAPSKKDSVSSIYLADEKKTVAVEKWYYDKRTVLIINDTIKDPNVK